MIDELQAAELFAMRDSLRKAERDYKAKDEVAKAARKRMEAEQKEFNEYVDDLANPTPKLPFPDDAGGHPIPVVGAVGPGPGGGDYRVVGDDERWRLTAMEDLAAHGLSAGDMKKLSDTNPPITTLGELADFTADGSRRLVDIPGVGEVSANRITDAVIGWHEANPRKIGREKPTLDASGESPQDELGDGDGSLPERTPEGPAESILDDSGVVPVDTAGDGDSLHDDDWEKVNDGTDE